VEIIENTVEFHLNTETAAAVGKFDGVHIGHRRLLEEILNRKGQGLASCVFTFDPAPAVLFGYSDGKELTTRAEKRLLFGRMGVDIFIEFPLDRETAAMLPEVFARDVLAGEMNVRFLAAGHDLSFGSGGRGNAALLRKLAPELGFTVETIDKICLDGEEVSSTLVRRYVEAGNLEAVEKLLGEPYLVAGKVVRGNQIGRTLGFPTVNIEPPPSKLLPPCGVYFSRVRHRGKLYRAITNVGYKPTVTDRHSMGVESYLYDFQEEIYGEEIEVYLCSFRRPERQFASVEALRQQLQADIAAGSVNCSPILKEL